MKVVNVVHKGSVQELLRSLDANDYAKIKEITGVARVCYYERDPTTQDLTKVCH